MKFLLHWNFKLAPSLCLWLSLVNIIKWNGNKALCTFALSSLEEGDGGSYLPKSQKCFEAWSSLDKEESLIWVIFQIKIKKIALQKTTLNGEVIWQASDSPLTKQLNVLKYWSQVCSVWLCCWLRCIETQSKTLSRTISMPWPVWQDGYITFFNIWPFTTLKICQQHTEFAKVLPNT